MNSLQRSSMSQLRFRQDNPGALVVFQPMYTLQIRIRADGSRTHCFGLNQVKLAKFKPVNIHQPRSNHEESTQHTVDISPRSRPGNLVKFKRKRHFIKCDLKMGMWKARNISTHFKIEQTFLSSVLKYSLLWDAVMCSIFPSGSSTEIIVLEKLSLKVGRFEECHQDCENLLFLVKQLLRFALLKAEDCSSNKK